MSKIDVENLLLNLRDHLRIVQVETLFRNVSLAVIAAAVSAAVLAGELTHLGVLPGERSLGFAAYIAICALAHIALGLVFRRRTRQATLPSIWAIAFTGICLGEGIGWGWASVRLLPDPALDVSLLVLVVTYAIAAASVSVFDAYLPSFYAFFLPTTLPFPVASMLSTNSVERAATLLSIIFVVVIGGLGWRANAIFKQLVLLRLETQNLAADLGRQKDIAEQASIAKSSFLAAASHDLRQPVHALGLFVGALRGTALPETALRLTHQIEASIVALDSLFTALLDISRLDAGVVEVHPQVFPIQPLLDRLLAEHASEARSKSLTIVGHPSSAAVATDPILLERVLRNLISNAVRYTDAGRVVVGCRWRGPTLSIEVWDTGRGIPVAMQQKVFQEYVQVGNPERDRSQGLGLGLAIVRRVTDLLGCRLTMRSEPGRGSCFGIDVPLADRAAIVDRASQDRHPTQGLGSGLVVVVDDEAAVRDAMSTLLGTWGYDVRAAGSGDEIMAILAECPILPDLIISDYRLRAGENGIDVVERLRSEYNEAIPSMLITGDTAPARLIEAEASGLLLLHKPVARSKLRASISALLAQSRITSDQPAEGRSGAGSRSAGLPFDS